MAAVAPPPSKLGLRGSRNNNNSAAAAASAPHPPRSTTGHMTDIMSYQYPPPPSGAEMDMPPAGYMSNYSVAHQSSSGMDMRNSPDQGIDPLSKSLTLKRSMSTPSVRLGQPQPLPAQDPNQDHFGGGLSSAEKRRNKLGYHRTSVACGHCRRRKIRCIPRANDVHGRCENCIRLKKECSFYPVDQQPPPDARHKSTSSQASRGPRVSSANSSPSLASGHPSELHSHHGYPQMGIPSMAPPSMKPGSDGFGPETKMHAGGPARAFSDYSTTGMTNWMAAAPSDASPGHASSKPGDLGAGWRSYPHESPVTPAFPPYTAQAAGAWATTPVSAGGRDDMAAWSSSYSAAPTPRSLSFGAEGLGAHQQQAAAAAPYPPMSAGRGGGAGYGRRPSGDMYAGAAPVAASSLPDVGSLPSTSLSSAGSVPSSSYGGWSQQPQAYAYAKVGDGYGGWYGEAAGGPAQGAQGAPDAGGMGYYASR